MTTFNFTITFTRADENHENTYTIGYNVQAYYLSDAWTKIARLNSHLAVSNIALSAIMDEDGNILSK